MKKPKASEPENGVDMISDLPDPILHLILSGLPSTEEVVRTSILSTRWRYLWIPIPSIDIDCSRGLKPFTNFKKKEFKEFVYWVLVNKTLDLKSFRLDCADYCNMSTITRWIHAAVMRKVKLLDLSFYPLPRVHRYDAVVIQFPNSLVKYDSLEVLRLFLYKRCLFLPTVTVFPVLRVFELNSVELLNEDDVQLFLKRCPLLEDLSFIDCFSHLIVDLCISCPNLKTLRIHNKKKDTEEFDDDDGDDDEGDDDDDDDVSYNIQGLCNLLQISCPKLVFLEYVGQTTNEFSLENVDSLKKAVIYPDAMAQKGLSFESFGDTICEFFAGVSHVESLSLNLSFIQAINAVRDTNGNFPASLPNLKTLEISTTIDEYAMNVVIRILRFCPNLESFHLVIEEEIFWLEVWELDVVLTHHLKRVEFLEFNGERRKVDMACFLLRHGNELEEMVFSWRDKVNYHEKSTSIMQEVLKFYKASSTVKVITLLKD